LHESAVTQNGSFHSKTNEKNGYLQKTHIPFHRAWALLLDSQLLLSVGTYCSVFNDVGSVVEFYDRSFAWP
jgi:hypothetical protein